MKFKKLIKAEWVMLIGEVKQYLFNYIFYNIGLFFVFIGLFYAFKQDGTKDATVLLYGLIIWQLCNTAINYLSNVIQDESMLGTLEQIFMTRTSVFSVFFSKLIVNLVFGMIKIAIVFILCVFIFDVQDILVNLGIINIYIFIITIITVFSFYCLGLLFGGMALFFKRVNSFCSMLTYLLLFFTNITVPIESLPALIQPISYAIPITWAVRLINLLVFGAADTSIITINFIGFIITSGLYLVGGVIAFNLSIKRAKELGKLGQY